MIKEEYVLDKIKLYINHSIKEGKAIDPIIMNELIEQWEFDHEMDLEYRPEVLRDYKVISMEVINGGRLPVGKERK